MFCIVSRSRFVTQPTDTSAATPFSGILTCSIRGYGYQTITWHRRHSTLPYKYEVKEKISNRVVTSVLVIPNVTKEDAGKYYCKVWANNKGVKSKDVNLFYSGVLSIHNTHNICMYASSHDQLLVFILVILRINLKKWLIYTQIIYS